LPKYIACFYFFQIFKKYQLCENSTLKNSFVVKGINATPLKYWFANMPEASRLHIESEGVLYEEAICAFGSAG
jgi:hypothetical protein